MPAPAQCPRAAHREQTAFRISAFTFRLSMIAAALCAVNYVAYEAKWYAAIEALLAPVAVPLISGPARAIDTTGILLAIALLLGAALVLSFLHWKDWKVQKPGQGDGLKKAKPGPPDDHPSQSKADDPQKADRVDPRIEREFNNVFMTASKEGKQALIKRWMDRKKCDREEAMRLAHANALVKRSTEANRVLRDHMLQILSR